MSYTIASDPSLSPPNGAAMIAFMQSFYATSDTESSHDAYVDSFTDDATLIMGPKTAKGSSGTFPRFSTFGIPRPMHRKEV